MAFVKGRSRIAREARVQDLSRLSSRWHEAVGLEQNALRDFVKNMHGPAVVANDPRPGYGSGPSFNEARQGSDPAFQAFPKIIAYCETFGDVGQCLKFARTNRLRAVCRSGGHSTAGFSVVDGGIVIDLSRIAYVHVDPGCRKAAVGAGTSFGMLNASLDPFGLHVPGGACEDVCVGGYMQGGGYGFTAREFGMHCDNVTSVLVMLANGAIVEASHAKNRDLYWAIRGGTGNNFGVLLEVRYSLHELPQAWGFALRWSLAEAPAVLQELQSNYMAGGAAPDGLGYMVFICEPAKADPGLLLRGVYHGTEAQGRRHLASVAGVAGVQWDEQRTCTGSYQELNHLLLEDLDTMLPYYAVMEDKECGYISKPLTIADWKMMIAHWQRAPHLYNLVCIEPYGGRINRIPKEACAFIHRTSDMNLYVDSFWTPGGGNEAAAKKWLDDFMVLMQPHFNTEVYQNYPRRRFASHPNIPYQRKYWGDAFSTLLAIKRKYDPDGFFTFDQCVQWTEQTPAPGEGQRWVPVPPEIDPNYSCPPP